VGGLNRRLKGWYGYFQGGVENVYRIYESTTTEKTNQTEAAKQPNRTPATNQHHDAQAWTKNPDQKRVIFILHCA
jgi:hypothetical protein